MYINLTVSKTKLCHLFPKEERKGRREEEHKKERRKEGRKKEREKNGKKFSRVMEM